MFEYVPPTVLRVRAQMHHVENGVFFFLLGFPTLLANSYLSPL